MKIRRVPKKQFWEEYKRAFAAVDVPTEAAQAALRRRIYSLQDAISDFLSQRWKKEDDFEIGDDYNYCYHVCGGVYSNRVVCADYLKRVSSALRTDPEPEIWTFHTAVETGKIDGQFFMRNGEIVCPDAGPNFAQLLNRKFVIW